MNIRNAILNAADHIEQNPRLFRFCSVDIPGNCGTPGCALGWIGYFAGIKDNSDSFLPGCSIDLNCVGLVKKITKVKSSEFYNRMMLISNDGRWIYDNIECARDMRLYADKYHPASKPLPSSVTNIFKMSSEAIYKELRCGCT